MRERHSGAGNDLAQWRAAILEAAEKSQVKALTISSWNRLSTTPRSTSGHPFQDIVGCAQERGGTA
jgi:hypothetical protein